MSGSIEPRSELSRDLTLFHVTMMGLGMMIGAGVFIGIGNTLNMVGPGGMILTFTLNGLIALFTAMSYAELSSAIPRAGGAYNFARLGFGKGTSFIAGWMEWFASSVAGSLYAVVFATYTLEFFKQLGYLEWLPFDYSIAVKIVAGCVACVFIYINYRGSSETGKIGAFFTLGQMVLVLGIAVLGIIAFIHHPDRVLNFEPFMPKGWSKLLVSMGFIFVAFEGYEVIAQAGDETIDPKKNIPKAMLYSVFIVTLTYIAVSFGTIAAVGANNPELAGVPVWKWIGSFGDTGFGEAVAMLMPSKFVGFLLVSLAVIFSSTSALNATIYSATRAAYALGRDRMLPGQMAKISKKRKTPYVALFVTGVIVLLVATLLPTKDVASSASIMFIFLFFLVNMCVIKIRYNMGDELEYGFLMPFFPAIPILAMLCQAGLVAFMHEEGTIALIIAAVWIGAGFLIYMFYSRSRAVDTEDEIKVIEEIVEKVSGKRYKIMMSVANPSNALPMIRTTYAMAKANDAEIELLHMVPVPDQVPLSDADKYMWSGKEAIVETMLYLAPMFPISSTIRYCRNIARGIISAVRQKNVDLLILGWHGNPKKSRFRVGSTIDPVMERTPSRVMVLKGHTDQISKNILVPIAGGGNSAFAIEVATTIARENEGCVTLFSVKRAGDDKAVDFDSFLTENKIDVTGDFKLAKKITTSEYPVEAILSELDSADYDLLVLGASKEPKLKSIGHETIPERLCRKSKQPVIMVKASGGITSWLRRWF
ncbi:MAG: amino acid permease [Kiritimatiellae bacterium]|jgi:APA family basic amino acid/polyamine antiporter|nr:amino acid permease [Kiritimatiellia bacterium]